MESEKIKAQLFDLDLQAKQFQQQYVQESSKLMNALRIALGKEAEEVKKDKPEAKK